MSKSQKSNKYIKDWRISGKQYAESERGVYESKNVSVIIALVLSLVANLLSLICIIVSGIDLGIAFVALMLASDIAFIVLFSKVNFCCRYSALFVAIYLAFNVVMTVLSILCGFSVIGDGSLFTVFGLIMRIASLLVFSAVLLMSVVTARKTKKVMSASIVLSVIMLGGLVYTQLFGGGYYGQNFSVLSGERTVEYVLCENEMGESYYKASRVLPGLGTKVVVDDTYLGAEVREIEAEVLTAQRLQSIKINGEKAKTVVNAESLAEAKYLPKITVEKTAIEAYRNAAFTAESAAARDILANSFTPVLEANEVAVRFLYDTDLVASELYNKQNVMPVLIKQKGESVTLSDLTELLQNYYTQETPLEWSYENAYGWNLLGLTVDGESVIDTQLSGSVDVAVSFEQVKKINFELLDAYQPTDFDSVGYISQSAEEVTVAYDTREGCFVTMTLDEGIGFTTNEESLRAAAFQASGTDLTASVVYELYDPVIDYFGIFANEETAAKTTFTYGDILNAQYAIKEHGANISYTLTEKQGESNAEPLEFASGEAFGVRVPNTIVYKLVARVDDKYVGKDMFKETEQEITVQMNKKNIEMSWNLDDMPADNIYDGDEHTVTYTIDQSQAVDLNGVVDVIAVGEKSNMTVKNVVEGGYTFTVALTDDNAAKYNLTNPIATYTLNKKTVTADWFVQGTGYNKTAYTDSGVTYNGYDYTLSATYTGVDQTQPVALETVPQNNGVGRGAGMYYTVVGFASDDEKQNYTLEEADKTLLINKAQRAISWYNGAAAYDAETGVVYKGANYELTPKYTDVYGVQQTVVATGTRKNVGTQLVTTPSSNDNYTFTDYSVTLKITEYIVEALAWETGSFTYTGNAQMPKPYFTGVGDDAATRQYATVTADSVNAGSRMATAGAPVNDNYKFSDSVANKTEAFTIGKATATVTWGKSSFTYNGEKQTPTATITGVTADGKLDSEVTVNKENINADSYTATVSLTDSTDINNYTLTFGSAVSSVDKAFTIGKATATVTWDQTVFTYNGSAQCPQPTVTGVNNTPLTSSVSGEKTNASAGNYTATVSLTNETDIQNYNYNATTSFKINKATVEVDWTVGTYTYTGSEQKPTAQFTGVGNDGNINLNVTVDGGINAGTHTATASTDNGNYTLTGYSKSYTIAPKEINGTAINWSKYEGFYYKAGIQQKPEANFAGVGNDGTINLTVSVVGGINAGTYTATASTSNTNYTLIGVLTKSYEIAQAEVTVSWGTTLSWIYDNNPHRPDVTVGLQNGNGNSYYTVSNQETDVGSYIATVTLTDTTNYKFADGAVASQAFAITQAEFTVTWTNITLTYDGTSKAPTASVKTTNGATPTLAVVVAEGSAINVGSYTASISFDTKNFKCTDGATTSFKITAKEVEVDWTNTVLTYNGEEQAPKATYKDINGNDVDVDLTISGAKVNVGTGYTATATLDNNNYTLKASTATTTFEIVSAQVDVSWTNDGNGIPQPTFSVGGKTVTLSCTRTVKMKGTDQTVSESDYANLEAGEYVVTIALTGNDANNYSLKDNDTEFTVENDEEE